MAGVAPVHSIGEELGDHLGGALQSDGVTRGLRLFGHCRRSLISQLCTPFKAAQHADICCKRKSRATVCIAEQGVLMSCSASCPAGSPLF